MPTPFTTKPTLTGERVLLRPLTADDAETMVELMADPEVSVLTGSVTSRAEAAERMPLDRAREWYGSRGDTDDRVDLAVVDRATGAVVGEVVLKDWDADCGTAHFRTFLGAAGRDRGLGTESLRLLLAYAFDTVGLHRVGLEVLAHNPRARHVYEKVGFVLEGTRREEYLLDGHRIDAHDMGILAREWAAHRGHPETAAS